MLEYIKSIDLSDEIKTNDIYNLIKTDSSELNLNLLSTLQNFHTINEFLNFYTKQDCKFPFDIFNNLVLISSKFCKENEKIVFKSEIDKYLSNISKIIILFSLIQKNNELLSNLLKNAKTLIKQFYDENKNNSNIIEKINICYNELMSSSQITSQRNYSRRSTRDNTISGPNKLSVHNLGKFKFENNTNDNEYLLFQCFTPKFEEEDENQIVEVNEEQSCKNNINLENIKKNISETSRIDSKKTIGSSLSFKYMKCVYDSSEEKSRHIKKKKTVNMGIDFSNPKNFFKKKSISNKINNSNNEDLNYKNEYNIKTLAKFLNLINNLFKSGKITSKEKIAIKHLIITNSEELIEKYNIYINNSEKNNKISIKKFLLKQIKISK